MFHPEITWYKVLVLIVGAMAIGFGIANMVYFNKIRLEGQCSPVSTSTATTLLWLNLFLVIFGSIVFFWSLFRLIFTGHEAEDKVNTQYNLHTHITSTTTDTDTAPLIPTASPLSTISEQGFQV